MLLHSSIHITLIRKQVIWQTNKINLQLSKESNFPINIIQCENVFVLSSQSNGLADSNIFFAVSL